MDDEVKENDAEIVNNASLLSEMNDILCSNQNEILNNVNKMVNEKLESFAKSVSSADSHDSPVNESRPSYAQLASKLGQ